MEYLKPHLSLSQQVALLQQRGLVADASLLTSRLRNVGYYRFSAYLHPFRVRNSNGQIEDNYVPGTTLDKVWSHYLFDRKLRFLMMDAIERIEVALRSQIAYHLLQDNRRSPMHSKRISRIGKGIFKAWSVSASNEINTATSSKAGLILLTTSSTNTAISMIICRSGWLSE